MNNCIKCGEPVRLRATRISFNRKRGVANYIEHMSSTKCDATNDYNCSMMKPYRKPSPSDEMMDRWNEANPSVRESDEECKTCGGSNWVASEVVLGSPAPCPDCPPKKHSSVNGSEKDE